MTCSIERKPSRRARRDVLGGDVVLEIDEGFYGLRIAVMRHRAMPSAGCGDLADDSDCDACSFSARRHARVACRSFSRFCAFLEAGRNAEGAIA